jgi:putative transposase
MGIKDELIDELLKDYKKPEDLLGNNGILKELEKRMLDRVLKSEMEHHLGYKKHSEKGNNSGNSRNGSYSKKLKTKNGELELDVPRDRNGDFEPLIVPKGKTRISAIDNQIISLYARGMTTREVQSHLEEMYEVDVSADLISKVTDSVIEDVKDWQQRPLNEVYPIVYFDAMVVKVRDEGHIRNKAIYIALGINLEGQKEVLGLWIEQTEGAKFWLQVMNELNNRGLKDIFIACIDGLKGFPDAIETVFPKCEVQLCIVHMVRNSLKFVPWQDRKKVATDLKTVYQSATQQEATNNLKKFQGKWDGDYPMIFKSWNKNWDRLTVFFNYPPEIRKVIYTTNAIESLNMSLRKIIKNRGSFPTDQAVSKILFLALRNISKKWNMPIRSWGKAINQFSIMFEGRLPSQF